MRILSLLYICWLLLESEGAVSVPAPASVKVMSDNFVHILQWSPGKGTKPGTVYNVMVVEKKNRNLVPNITGTFVDISEHMAEKLSVYRIRLWATFRGRSSSQVQIEFVPYTSTIIGPPRLSLSGCGHCLNISIDLPNRPDSFDSFYNAICFDIHWKKVSGDKDDCQNPFTSVQSQQAYFYQLDNLQPGERYCVQVQPKVQSIPEHQLLHSCSCEFTSRIEPRGVAFLVGWVSSSILVGLSFLTFIYFLIYTGFLCKPNIRLPKALIILVPGYIMSPEMTPISVAEVDNNIQIWNSKDKNCEDNDDAEQDDDDNEDEESHHNYMDRGVPSKSESTGSGRPVSDCEAAENPGVCDVEDTRASDTLLLSQVQHSERKNYSLGNLLFPGTKSIIPKCNAKGRDKLGEEMRKEEKEEGDDENVNLWSVVLKSMHFNTTVNEPSDAKENFLPLLLKESGEHEHTGSSSELHTALLLHTQTEAPSSQEEEHDDIFDTSFSDQTRTGYMASHTGEIDSEQCSSSDEE